MSLVIDLIIIICAVFAIYLGIVKGFVRSVMQFLSIILAIIAVMILTNPVAGWLSDAFVSDKVTAVTEDSLEGIVGKTEEIFDLDRLLGDSLEILTDITDRFGVELDSVIDNAEGSLTKLTEKEALGELSRQIAEPTADAISTVLAAILVFIVSLLALALVTYILDLVCRLPVLKKLNTVLGFLFGVGSALMTTVVLSNIAVGLITSFEAVNSTVFSEAVIDGSLILRFFITNNLIFF